MQGRYFAELRRKQKEEKKKYDGLDMLSNAFDYRKNIIDNIDPHKRVYGSFESNTR